MWLYVAVGGGRWAQFGRVELTFRSYPPFYVPPWQMGQTYRGIRLHTNTLFFRFPTRAAKKRSGIAVQLAFWRAGWRGAGLFFADHAAWHSGIEPPKSGLEARSTAAACGRGPCGCN